MATFFDRHIRQDQEENFFDQFDSAEENAPQETGNFFDQFDEEERDTSDTTEYENPVARGFAAGVDQLQGIGGGLAAFAGDVVGSDRLRDWGVDVYQQNMAEAAVNQNEQNFTDIDSVTDALGWAGYTLGNLAPMMAPSLLTGGVGGIAAKQGAKELAKRVIAEEVAKGATKKEAAKIAGEAVAKRVAAGSAFGAGGASVGMSTGEIYGDTGDEGVAATHGVVAGAVDALPVVRVLDKLGLGKAAGDEIKKSVLKEAGKQSLFEGGTEAFQTLVEQHARHWVENNGESLLGNLGEANWNEIVEATAAGALGGGVMGAPAQMYQNRQIGKREQAENERQRVIEEAKRRVRESGGSEVDELNAAAQADLSVDSYIDDVSVDDIRQNIQEELVEADRDTSGDIGAVNVKGPLIPQRGLLGTTTMPDSYPGWAPSEEQSPVSIQTTSDLPPLSQPTEATDERTVDPYMTDDLQGAQDEAATEEAGASGEQSDLPGAESTLEAEESTGVAGDFLPPGQDRVNEVGAVVPPEKQPEEEVSSVPSPSTTNEVEKESGEAETFAPTLTASGKPFKTEKSALASAKQKKVPNAKAVQVDGGWGYVTEKPEQDVTPTESNTSQENIPSENNDLPPQNQEAVATDQETPSILTDTPAKAKTRIARERGLKKGSPGYKDAVEAAYDEEYERALASLPFEEYQRQEPDQPEAVQRQTWEALREEHSITETPNVPAGRPGRDTDLAPQQPDDQTGSQGAVGRDDGVRTGDSDTGAADTSDVVGDPADLGAADADVALDRPYSSPEDRDAAIDRLREEAPGWAYQSIKNAAEYGASEAEIAASLGSISEDDGQALNDLVDAKAAANKGLKQGFGERSAVDQSYRSATPSTHPLDVDRYGALQALSNDDLKRVAKAAGTSVGRNLSQTAIIDRLDAQPASNVRRAYDEVTLAPTEAAADGAQDAALSDSSNYEMLRDGVEPPPETSSESPAFAHPPESKLDQEGPNVPGHSDKNVAPIEAESQPTLSKSGKPFKGRGSAQLAAKRAGIENAEVVEVEGGFGYRAADSSPATESEVDTARNTSTPVEAYGDESLDLRRRQDMGSSLERELTDDDIASQPLSKIWPKQEVDAIEDTDAAAFATAVRDSIPAKPRKSSRKARWVEEVKAAREVMRHYQNNPEKVLELAKGSRALRGMLDRVEVLKSLDRSEWSRVGSVRTHPTAHTYSKSGEKVPAPQVSVEIDGRGHTVRGAKTAAEAIDSIKEKLASSDPKATTGMKFTVRGRPGRYFIHKDGDSERRPLATFDTTEAAFDYRKNNYDDLVKAWDEVKERDNVKKTDVRSKENRARTGADYRQGRDISPQEFVEQFGLRHVDFGKWVKDGDGERQRLLNQTYDALMDLSNIVGIPPSAIGLEGNLIFTFGKRGSGSASAHFEAGTNKVINLTKTKGAGSLGHEWFHALDNYFQEKRGPHGADRENAFITYAPENFYRDKKTGQRIPEREFDVMAEGGVSERGRRFVMSRFDRDNWELVEGVRPEVAIKFAELVEALDKSPMKGRSSVIDKGRSDGYWSRVLERAARSFENYLIAKMEENGYNNDFLANVVSPDRFARNPERYPYLLPEETAPVSDAFDSLFETIESDSDSGMLYSREAYVPADAKPKGVGKGTAQLAVNKFLKQYKGADDVNVVVARNYEEHFGQKPKFRTKGGYSPKTDTLYLFTDELDSVAELGETLRHEILVHKGLGMVEPAQLKQLLDTFYASAKDSPELAQIVGEVQRVEKGRSDRVKAEEILARIGQEKLSFPDKVLNKLFLAIQRMLNSVGLGKVSARRQGKDLVYRIADAFAEGKRAQRRDMDMMNQSVSEDNGPGSTAFDPAQADSPNLLYSRTDDTFTPPVGERSSYDENYEKLGNKDRTVFQKAKAALKREVTPGGLLPNSVFKLKLSRDFKINGFEFDIANRLGHFEQEVKSAYGKGYDKLPESEKEKINAMLGGELDESIPEAVRSEVHKMRAVIRGLSRAYAQQLEGQIADLEAAGDPEALQKAALLETINQNMDTYVHRSYRAFDDPDWPRKVPRDVFDRAVRYLESQYAGDGPVTAEVEDKVNRKIELLLHEGTAFDSMEAFISESKLGAKDLSVLKKRKQIAPEIRALLGEYTDPKINFTKSVTKMARLVLNQRFLDRVKEIGMGDFLFDTENAPRGATAKIAGEASDTYSPLNGLYTYPEVEQAFRDALGKEKIDGWFRTVVRLNGMVKYGKTVLSPTTAARNWMSAAFFAMGNGHFDISQMKKSVAGLREYFTHRGEAGKTAYLRKLKDLGVVYDSPYAGEMMDLLADSRMEDTLFSKGPMASVKRANDFAQKFYQYGDDFWKILGFENEKAMLMKHRGMTEAQAEREAAERIRNTYPTYSLTGRFVQRLRRFPLAGTFVSFPAEIIRTSYHIVRYAVQDMKEAPAMGARKIAGLGIASGMIHALQAVSMALTGMDDEEEEAFRQLAAPWQRNSNLLSFGRNEDGDTRLLDMSFLDPYNYWKRPLNAALRGQPVDDLMKEVAREVLSPFFGQDIAFQAITEAITNQKSSGGRVFNPDGPTDEQIADIGNHLRKALQPGALSNAERIVKAMSGEVSASGKPYTMRDEMAALAGFRMTTFDPKASLYYKAFEFQDKKRNASNILSSAARSPNRVSDDKLRSAYENALETRMEAYEDMATLVNAALKSGLNKGEVFRSLRNSGVSAQDARSLLVGRVPRWKPPTQMMRNAQKKAEVLFDRETAAEFRRREQVIREAAREALR